jgi:hypothetical protein
MGRAVPAVQLQDHLIFPRSRVKIPGDSTALVAINNNIVQIAFNKSVLKKEEIVAINSGLSDFLVGMSMEQMTFVYVNVGQRMRGTQPVCGQLWIQDDRRMTPAGTSLPGMGGSREEVSLSGISDALAWRHGLETNDYKQNPDYKRPVLRLVIYPEVLSKLGLILTTGNLGLDSQEKY